MGNNASENNIADTNKKIEAIIRSVAVKHGIALGRDDPILVLHTLNELLINELAKKQEDLLQQFQVSLEEASDHWSKNMEVKDAEFISRMENSHRQPLKELIQKQADNLALAIRDINSEMVAAYQKKAENIFKLLNNNKSIRLMLYVNLGLSIIVLVLVFLLCWMLIN